MSPCSSLQASCHTVISPRTVYGFGKAGDIATRLCGGGQWSHCAFLSPGHCAEPGSELGCVFPGSLQSPGCGAGGQGTLRACRGQNARRTDAQRGRAALCPRPPRLSTGHQGGHGSVKGTPSGDKGTEVALGVEGDSINLWYRRESGSRSPGHSVFR